LSSLRLLTHYFFILVQMKQIAAIENIDTVLLVVVFRFVQM